MRVIIGFGEKTLGTVSVDPQGQFVIEPARPSTKKDMTQTVHGLYAYYRQVFPGLTHEGFVELLPRRLHGINWAVVERPVRPEPMEWPLYRWAAELLAQSDVELLARAERSLAALKSARKERQRA